MKVTVLSLVLILSLGVASTASAADKKTVAGALLVAGGVGSMLGAFGYRTECPSGYSTHTFQGSSTQCVYINYSSGNSDVRTASTKVRLRRPEMLYAGAGAVAGGVVLLLIPKRAANGVTLSIAPKNLLVSKTIHF